MKKQARFPSFFKYILRSTFASETTQLLVFFGIGLWHLNYVTTAPLRQPNVETSIYKVKHRYVCLKST